MAQHGKRYTEAREKIDREHAYTPLEAVRLVRDAPAAKFDEAVEVHFNLGLNVRHADQQLRGTLMLPHGTGKDVKIAVFAEGEKAREAEEAGADLVGSADLAAQIEGGFDDFDVAIATPDMMGTVGKLGRILGPRGKMPNPKTGTVTFDVGKAVREAKAGKLEYRTDRGANVHLVIGRKSFDERTLLENYATVVEEIVRAKPAAAKGRYIRSITLTSSMGPGVRVDPARTRAIAAELQGGAGTPQVLHTPPSPKTARGPTGHKTCRGGPSETIRLCSCPPGRRARTF
jgi:large subunit ribosomal protein L1